MNNKFEELEEVISYIEQKISPYILNESGKTNLSVLLNKFGKTNLLDAIDISFNSYIRYDENHEISKISLCDFLNKIGGIAYNNSLPNMEKIINYILNCGYKNLYYWDDKKARAILRRYINALRYNDWNEEKIEEDLNTEVLNLTKESSNWSEWKNILEVWINDIYNWKNNDNCEDIENKQSILPSILFENTREYIEKLSKQINSSYENNLFDCTAVIMRRLMEVLLVLSFQYNNIEDKIRDKSGENYVNLDKIIKIAVTNKVLKLSSNTKKDMDIFRELGNLSAHKIWYNSTKKDIEPFIIRYRAIIEELLYKAGIKK